MKTPPVIWYAKQPRNTAELSPFPQRKAGRGAVGDPRAALCPAAPHQDRVGGATSFRGGC